MRVRVDKARRDGQLVGVQHGIGGGAFQIADFRDLSLPDRHIRPEPGRSRAVDHRSVPDQDIAHLFFLPAVSTIGQ